jgi:macrolide transport system ATP-binding/permease protein
MIWRDLRHGARMLVSNPGFGLITILSIGVGVGATAATFSFAEGLVLRPLGVPQPGEVLSIVGTSPERGLLPSGMSHPDYIDLRERSRTFESLTASRTILVAFDARTDRPALRSHGSAVNAALFEGMRIRPAIGRFFLAEEDTVPGRNPVLVLDHRTWRERFGSDPEIVGRRIRIAATDFTVIGVASESFKGLDANLWPAFYVPLAMLREVQGQPQAANSDAQPDELTRRDVRGLDIKGRLRPDATLEQAREEIARIGTDLARQFPDANRNRGLAVRTELEMRFGARADAMVAVMLLALAAVVLAVACANVAGLLTSRAPARAREIALRMAIGAGRVRLVRQLLAESLLIAGAGALVGLAIAEGATRLFRQIEFPADVPLKLYFAVDQRVLTVGLIAATVSAVLSSLVPAWQATRTDLVTVMKGATASGHARQWGRQSLVCLQVALALVLVTVAAALYSGIEARLLKGPGYRTERIALMRFDERLAGLDRDQAGRFYDALKERVRAMPGVTSVALTSMIPMKSDTMEFQRVAPDGVRLPDDAADVGVLSSRVDEGFFSTLSIPILAGRAFTAGDLEDTPRVAIVNRTLADRYWPGQNVVGKRIRVQPFEEPGDGWFEIVGVAATSAYTWGGENPTEIIYLPRTQRATPETSLVVATTGDAAAIVPALRDTVRSLAPDMPIFGVRTMADVYAALGVRVPRLIVRIVGAMGLMGAMLALAGLYGLVAYTVSRRTREIGIRMTVGAVPRTVLATVLRRGVLVTCAGMALGLAASVGAGRALEGAIPGLGRFGPWTYAMVVPAMFAVTLLAAYLPARRATRIDPLRALRIE